MSDMGGDIAAAPDSPNELDALLAQYETATAAPDGVTPPAADPATTGATEPEYQGRTTIEDAISDIELQERIRASRAAYASTQIDEKIKYMAAAQHEADLRETVAKVRGDLDPAFFDDKIVTAWLDSQAMQDVGLQRAWLERHTNPRAFDYAVNQLSKQFAKKYSRMPDPVLTEDRALVTAAVRNSGRGVPAEPPPNFSRMSNAEYRSHVIAEYGYDPGI